MLKKEKLRYGKEKCCRGFQLTNNMNGKHEKRAVPVFEKPKVTTTPAREFRAMLTDIVWV